MWYAHTYHDSVCDRDDTIYYGLRVTPDQTHRTDLCYLERTDTYPYTILNRECNYEITCAYPFTVTLTLAGHSVGQSEAHRVPTPVQAKRVS